MKKEKVVFVRSSSLKDFLKHPEKYEVLVDTEKGVYTKSIKFKLSNSPTSQK